MRTASLLLVATCALSAAQRPERYILLLDEQPLAARARSLSETRVSARRSALASKHTALRQALADQHVRVTGSDNLLVNAVFVEAPRGSEADLAALPGVSRVERLPRLKRHDDAANQLINIQGAWSAVNGSQNAGAGIRIAVLDSGIDSSHPALQDASLQAPSGFPVCNKDNGDCAWTNSKVIVARSYVNKLVGTDPATSRTDDLSPRDRVGHGTAVAVIAAGVRSTGPAETITGVAPRAYLGNYKIYGSPGVNGMFTYDDVVITALSDAVSDGMNVAVLSLGVPAPWGPNDVGSTCQNSGAQPCDWRAAAVENATRIGLTVVVSAGNDGDNGSVYPAYNSINTPGTATSAITVGASTNSHIYYQTVRVQGPGVPANLQQINAYFSDGPRPDPGRTAPIRDVTSTGDDGTACNPIAAGALNGAIAVVIRSSDKCGFATKILNAQRAGAVGVIIYQSDVRATGTFPITGVQETGIPAALIGGDTGAALKSYIAQQPGAAASMDPTFRSVNTTEYDTLARFSSRGPAIRTGVIKPELLAVGTDLYTGTQKYDPNGSLYDPSGYTAVNGTSFASAIVAGVVAMVKQKYPSLTPAYLKSAVVNTANNTTVSDFDQNGRLIQAGVLDQGAGKLDASAAVQTNITVSPSTVSFGILDNPGAISGKSVGLNFCNSGGAPVGLTLSVQPSFTTPNPATVQLDRTSLTVPANSCTSNTPVTVSLTGTRPRPGVYEGNVLVRNGAVPLHIPYLFMVGDGVPFNAFPISGGDFESIPGTSQDLLFKVTDQYGVPVPNAPVRFFTAMGNGTIASQDSTTDSLGIGFATATIGSGTGEQWFGAQIGSDQNFTTYFSGFVRPQPTISANGVVDAASGQRQQAYAPGSYISIYGQGLSDSLLAYNTPYLPLALAGVSVSFDVNYPARLQFVSANQINVQIPWELQGQTAAQLKVSIGDFSSPLVSVPLTSAAPAIFEYTDAAGRRLAAAVGDQGVIGGNINARRGSIISLYLNGLGPVNNQPASGEPASATTLSPVKTNPTVQIGGQSAEVLFAGLAPGYVGLYQINVRVPANASTGVQPVVVSVGAANSKSSNMPVE